MGVVANNLIQFGPLLFGVIKNFSVFQRKKNVEEIVERLLEPRFEGKGE